MPKFAASLGFLFADLPFLDRFAAARAGFAGVEYASPYAHDAKDMAGRLADHGLAQALFNLPAGDWAAGERGITILPGREGKFRDGVARALDYADVLGCERLRSWRAISRGGSKQPCRGSPISRSPTTQAGMSRGPAKSTSPSSSR
jgi:hydroxypyruvate isomerase